LTSTTATLNGAVEPNDYQVSDCHFSVSPAPPGGANVPCAQQVGSGSAPVAVSANLNGLSPSTIYTVTLSASSEQGSSSGSSVAFTTATGKALAQGGTSSALSVGVLKLSPTRFRRGKHTAMISKTKHKSKTPTATTISFMLSQAADVTLTFEQAQPGIFVGKRCAKPARAQRKARNAPATPPCPKASPVAHPPAP
ncbi:MAG: hypothetical protein ACRDK2_10645, partial [Solirubrobacteraceae bacterium]